MFAEVAKNQHYVWRHYIESWTIDGLITCRRLSAGETFTTNPKNVGAERYFYGVEPFSDAEIAYLRQVAGQSRTALGRGANLGFVELFTLTTQLRRLVDSLPPKADAVRRETEDRLRQAERGLGEAWHVAVEGKGSPFLDRLKAGDASFWLVEDEASEFCVFLGAQYTRTARMRNSVQAAVAPLGVDLARVWAVESHIWGTEIGGGLLAHSHSIHATVLHNNTRIPFITGDQPVVNLKAHDDPRAAFYYPVTPTTALLLSIEDTPARVARRDVGILEAERLNYDIYRWSDDQIYGTDSVYLETLSTLPKNPLY